MNRSIRFAGWLLVLAISVLGYARAAHAQASIVSLTPNVLYIDPSLSYSTMTLKLNAPASTITAIALSNSAPDVFSIDPYVYVAAGQSSVVFPVTPLALGFGVVTATLGVVSVTANVQIGPHAPALIGLAPDTVSILSVGGVTTLTVTLSDAALAATPVALTSSAPQIVTVPSSVVVQPGQWVATFQASSLAVGTATITATLGDVIFTSSVTVGTPPPPPPATCADATNAAVSAANGYAAAVGTLATCTQSKAACKTAIAAARSTLKTATLANRAAIAKCKDSKP